MYAIGGMGAGDVKMQMGFGAWVGAFYGMQATEMHPGAGWILVYAFCLAAVIGGVLALGMIVVRGQLKTNMANTREILGDLLGSGVGKASDQGGQAQVAHAPAALRHPAVPGVRQLFDLPARRLADLSHSLRPAGVVCSRGKRGG